MRSFVCGVKLEPVYCYCCEHLIIINKSVKQTYDLSQLVIINAMAKHVCKEILFEVTGNAVDIAQAHEIDLREAFGSINVRGGTIRGK